MVRGGSMSLFDYSIVRHRITGKLYRINGYALGYYMAIGLDADGYFRGKKRSIGSFWLKMLYKNTDLASIPYGKPH